MCPLFMISSHLLLEVSRSPIVISVVTPLQSAQLCVVGLEVTSLRVSLVLSLGLFVVAVVGKYSLWPPI